MIAATIGLIRFGFSLIFGITVSVLFAGIEQTKKNRFITGLLCFLFLFIQTFCWRLVGIDLTSKLYPLIVHLPLIFLFFFYFKRPLLLSTVSVLFGYLCCQAPKWVGFLAGSLLKSQLADHIFYIIAVFIFYILIKKYVAGSVHRLLNTSRKICLFLGGIPFFYYAFDYITTIYTDTLYMGTKWAVQFMPSIVSIFYLFFIVLYYAENQKQLVLQRELDMLDAQLRLAQTEFATMQQLQQNAASYRHDMRHHFTLLQGLATKENITGIKEYLSTAQSDMDAITPLRFCENETVNLILSAYVAKAKQEDTILNVEARLADTLLFRDTELCSLLSNSLENAIHACERIPDRGKRIILLRMYSKNNKLCIDLRNRYQEEPVFQDGLPITKEKGHGFGIKSIVKIIEKHGGVYLFSIKEEWFIFQATA